MTWLASFFGAFALFIGSLFGIQTVSSLPAPQPILERSEMWGPIGNIGGYYSRGGLVYWKEYRNASYGKVVEHALYTMDSNFQMSLKNPDFGKDKENVFYTNALVEAADPDSFEIISYDESLGTGYAKDKNKVYWYEYSQSAYDGYTVLELADPATFSVVSNQTTFDSKDSVRKYKKGGKVE